MTSPLTVRTKVPQETKQPPSVDNPLAERDPELMRLCAEQRDRCLDIFLRMHFPSGEPHLACF
jgi:hypothetical protein